MLNKATFLALLLATCLIAKAPQMSDEPVTMGATRTDVKAARPCVP